MPPKQNATDDPPDMPISLRLKYGVHTIFLLVDPLAPFSELTTELFSVLQDRHPDGLRPSLDEVPTPLPAEGADYDIAYGVLKNPHDDSKGWKDLRIKGNETPVSKGLRNNDMVAFVIRDADEADEVPVFVVHLPKFEEEEGDEDGNEAADGMDEDEDEDL
ncbi:hypothetical protein N8I77_012137 [Diaporthe amygdali]|uniref:Uncharacterized protein n=1 Tax=Phomopsis amygdali TaxID=1214568 RepID=A0AAD9S4C0_PHOAM|nr:hypothetical protein N8I77_012137 [Diaporthe amygdali]KAK2598749.1 hypothetical protein N8I77_012137 [Diaporthe amygdali]